MIFIEGRCPSIQAAKATAVVIDFKCRGGTAIR